MEDKDYGEQLFSEAADGTAFDASAIFSTAFRQRALQGLRYRNRISDEPELIQAAKDELLAKAKPLKGISMQQKRQRLTEMAERVTDPHYVETIGDLLEKVWKRIDIKYKGLTVTTDALVGESSMPTVWNSAKSLFLKVTCQGGLKTKPLTILHGINGVLKPGTLTLVLGPPGSGKSVFMEVLAGRLTAHQDLRIEGDIRFNDEPISAFEPRRTVGLVGQYDYHIPDMTVLETLLFAYYCQGNRMETAGIIARVNKRLDELHGEAEQNKAADTAEGGGEAAEPHCPANEYLDFYKTLLASHAKPAIILKVLGLSEVADTVVGDQMTRGVSGGQRKRVTTGEILVGPQNVLLMDEISTGLDSATTYSIVDTFRRITHTQKKTFVVSLLQPPPEVLYLFDDIILFTDGYVIYHGPAKEAVAYFGSIGFKCPARQDPGSFLQEVTTPLGQLAYATPELRSKRRAVVPGVGDLLVSVEELNDTFWNDTTWGQAIMKELEMDAAVEPKDPNALSRTKYAKTRLRLTWLVMKRSWMLNLRNKGFFIARLVQTFVVALIIASLFATITPSSAEGRSVLAVATLSVTYLAFLSMPQVAMVFGVKRIFYKQRDNNFYPPAAFSVGLTVTQIPQSFLEAVIFSLSLYWIAGLTRTAENFFIYFLVCFSASNCLAALFRLYAYGSKTMVVANAIAAFSLLFIMVTNGFTIIRTSIPPYIVWIYWINPFAWALRALAINELTTPRWGTIGTTTLENFGFFTENFWIWAAVGFLWGALVVFTLIGAVLLTITDPPKPKPSIAEEDQKEVVQNDLAQQLRRLSQPDCERPIDRSAESFAMASASVTTVIADTNNKPATAEEDKQDDVIPFTPISLVVRDMCYYVDDPSKGTAPGVVKDSEDKEIAGKLQLLHSISCHAVPKEVTALMGGSGAGKTTLMDCIAGYKTQGLIRGDILVNGHPKVQESWSRVVGYIQQQDIHSAQATVREALAFSARLRLPESITDVQVEAIVEQTLQVVELKKLSDTVIGDPGGSGLSIEQRKRLSIAVELVGLPSVIFMDEPTSGLDARAAAIVMRAIRNVGDGGRTIMVTIHQPSLSLFESFDSLILLQKGGRLTYFGPLGVESQDLIAYLESQPGVEPIIPGYNPATWMLEVTGGSMSTTFKSSGNDFPKIYAESPLRQENDRMADAVVEEGLATTEPLKMTSRYAAKIGTQYKMLLKKFIILYWRNPNYNFVRIIMTIAIAVVYGITYINQGDIPKAPGTTTSIANVQNVLGLLFSMAIFLGMFNSITVQPLCSSERLVFYRERACSMYSPVPYVATLGLTEIPYLFVQAVLMVCITYWIVGFDAIAWKFFYFFLLFFLTIAMYTYLGQFLVFTTPNQLMAQLLMSLLNSLWTYFNGFLVPYSMMPEAWKWMNRISPTTWVIYGLGCSQMCDSQAAIVEYNNETVSQLLKQEFGYEFDFIWWCVLIVAAYAIFFRFMAMLMLAKVNFQKR